MKKLVFLFVLIGSCFLGFGQDLQASFEDGNALYEEKKYNEAIEKYKIITDAGLESAALYYNLGNAYFKTNQLSKAILNYERATRLDPNDDDIRQNLNIANDATIDRFETLPEPMLKTAYQSIFRALQPGTWGVLALLFLILMLIGTYFYLYTAKRREGFSVGVFCFLLGIVSLWLGYAHLSNLRNYRPGIVTATSTYVKSGPGEKAEDVFILHEGTKATVTEYYNNWKKIKLPDGKIGWISAKDIIEI